MKRVRKLELGQIYVEYVHDDNAIAQYSKVITVFKFIGVDGDKSVFSVLDCCRSDDLEFAPEGYNKELRLDGMDMARLVSIHEIFELDDDEANKMAIAFL
jgi:hypothetical protein